MSLSDHLPKGLNEMKTPTKLACPRCDYPLVPVHAVEGSKRRVIAMSCPEPYCDHMQMLPSDVASELSRGASASLRAAN
jgi:hypothetical protein